MTRVGLIYVPERINVYLRFGRPRLEQLVDAHRRWVEFADGAVFCRIRWERAEYGTTCCRSLKTDQQNEVLLAEN